MSQFNNYNQYFSSVLVVIDSQVNDYHTLINGINPQAKYIILNAEKDGVSQITEALLNYPLVKTLHIISHGQPGYLYLGNSSLNYWNIAKYSSDLSQWSNLLGADGEILLYGCQVAQGQLGAQFIEKLHKLINVNIAASNTLTGNSQHGGNWDLEVICGKTISVLAFDLNTIKNYAGVLAELVNETFTGSAVSGNWIYSSFISLGKVK